jgi:hypothetical protein
MVEVEIFDSLNNIIRLEILNFVSAKCRTKAQIVKHLEEKLSQKITLPNLDQNHIPKLLKLGVIKKEAGFDEDNRPVTYFCPIAEKLEPLIDVVKDLERISNPLQTAAEDSITIIDNTPVKIDLRTPKTSKPKIKILMSPEEIERKGLARSIQYPLSEEKDLCIGRKHNVIDGDQNCRKKDDSTCVWPHLTLDDRRVSRHHARIFHEKGKYFLEDIYSKQGTVLIHVDGEVGVYLPGRLWERWGAKFSARAELRHLDLFKIGSSWLQFVE